MSKSTEYADKQISNSETTQAGRRQMDLKFKSIFRFRVIAIKACYCAIQNTLLERVDRWI